MNLHHDTRPELLNRLRAQKSTLTFRANFIQVLRTWMEKEKFLEVSTPILLKQTLPDAHIVPVTAEFHDDKKSFIRGKLRVSPEVSLKKLLAAGYEKIYELGSVFRSHEDFNSPLHTTEFTLLEWYRLNATLETLADDLRALIEILATTLLGKPTLLYQKQPLSLKKTDWKTYTVSEAFLKYGKIDLDQLNDWKELPLLLQQTLQKKNSAHTVPWKTFSYEEAFYWLLITEVEPHLPKDRGVFLTHYPNFAASFSRISKDNPRYALRFEAYLGGIEIANAFDELTDSQEQNQRMKQFQSQAPIEENIDTDLLTVLPYIEQASGIALGVDRLLMLLLNKTSVQEVKLFPTSELF